MGKAATPRALPENEAKAVARNLRVSPQKLNLVAQLIRGKTAANALADLEFSRKRMDATEDEELRAILRHNRDEEQEHAALVLEWIRRRALGSEGEIVDGNDERLLLRRTPHVTARRAHFEARTAEREIERGSLFFAALLRSHAPHVLSNRLRLCGTRGNRHGDGVDGPPSTAGGDAGHGGGSRPARAEESVPVPEPKAPDKPRSLSAHELHEQALLALCIAAPAHGREYLERLGPDQLSSPGMVRKNCGSKSL